MHEVLFRMDVFPMVFSLSFLMNVPIFTIPPLLAQLLITTYFLLFDNFVIFFCFHSLLKKQVRKTEAERTKTPKSRFWITICETTRFKVAWTDNREFNVVHPKILEIHHQCFHSVQIDYVFHYSLPFSHYFWPVWLPDRKRDVDLLDLNIEAGTNSRFFLFTQYLL